MALVRIDFADVARMVVTPRGDWDDRVTWESDFFDLGVEKLRKGRYRLIHRTAEESFGSSGPVMEVEDIYVTDSYTGEVLESRCFDGFKTFEEAAKALSDEAWRDDNIWEVGHRSYALPYYKRMIAEGHLTLDGVYGEDLRKMLTPPTAPNPITNYNVAGMTLNEALLYVAGTRGK